MFRYALVASVILVGIFYGGLHNDVHAGINDDLVSYWNYDEGADDTCTGNEDVCDTHGSNHGERAGVSGANNLPQWSDSVKPDIAADNPYAMNFDGSDDEVTGIGDIDFPNNAFSVTAWIRPEAWGVSGDQYIHNLLCDEAAGAVSTFCFRIGSKGLSSLRQRVAVMIHDGGANDYESSSNLSLDTWTHVAVTFDGSDVKFYINGALDRTQTANVTMDNGSGGFRMGASPASERFYDGSIDELRTYDRAITQTEIDELASNNPEVNALSPADNATGVARSSNLEITFDRNMQAVSGKNVTIKKSSDDSTVETIAADGSEVSISSATVTINPDTTLDSETSYYVNIDSGAFEDTSGNDYSGISGATTWNFTTEDITDPTASSFLPSDGATDVDPGSNLIITFSESVDAESGTNNDIIIKKSSDDSVIETIDAQDSAVTGSGSNSVTINPTSDLADSTEYYIQIEANAFDDSAGNSYAGISDTTTWSFTTGDSTNPTVSSFSPTDNATNIAVGTNLVITFSEAVDAESGNITLKKASDNSTVETFDVTTDISGSGSTEITINPASDLENSTEYYVQIDATAFDDASGNSYAGLDDTTTWSFATKAKEIVPSQSSGIISGGIMYGCTDKDATNYEYFATHKQSLCKYSNDTESAPTSNQQTNTGSTSTVEEKSISFPYNLRAGMNDPYVKKLQQYLNDHGFILANTGYGSPGNETNYFGPLTYNALVRFQEAYVDEILRPWGLTRGTGLLGRTSRAFIEK